MKFFNKDYYVRELTTPSICSITLIKLLRKREKKGKEMKPCPERTSDLVITNG